MNFDFVKVVAAISKGMAIVDKIKSASGKDKAAAVADSIPEMVEAVEYGISRDILNDAAVSSARDNMVAGIKSFYNAVEAAKRIKGTGAAL